MIAARARRMDTPFRRGRIEDYQRTASERIALDGSPAETVDRRSEGVGNQTGGAVAARKASKKAAETAAPAVVKPKPVPAPPTETPERLRDRVPRPEVEQGRSRANQFRRGFILPSRRWQRASVRRTAFCAYARLCALPLWTRTWSKAKPGWWAVILQKLQCLECAPSCFLSAAWWCSPPTHRKIQIIETPVRSAWVGVCRGCDLPSACKRDGARSAWTGFCRTITGCVWCGVSSRGSI
jgi:hypothetical protein